MAPRWLKACALGTWSTQAALTADDQASLLQRKSVEHKKIRTGKNDCGQGLTLNLGSEIAINELHIPESRLMKWNNVHPTIDNVDLEISVVSGGGFFDDGDPGTPNIPPGCNPSKTDHCPTGAQYCPADRANNKMTPNGGEFVQFSMLCGGSNEQPSTTKLKFQLMGELIPGAPKEPMTLEQFTISVYDVDEGIDEDGHVQGRETVRACGGAQAVHMPLSETEAVGSEHIAQLNVHSFDDGCTEVISTSFGNKANNPTSSVLDADQAKRTVDFIFDGDTKAELEFSLSNCKCGRNLLFAFTPAVSCLVPPTTAAPPADPEPQEPDVDPTVEARECRAIGDPHVVTFDATSGSLPMYEDGDFWFIRSDPLKVQGRNWAKHWRGQASVKALAISGSLINNDVLIIDGPSEKVQLNHEEILSAGWVSDFQGNGWHAERQFAVAEANWALVDTVFLHLPHGIIITVNIWQNGHIDVMIKTHPIRGQDGWCGNFNGDATDDQMDNLNARFPSLAAEDSERLFRTRSVDYVGCYGADWEGGFEMAPGSAYTVEECANACHATDFFTRRNGDRCYCGDHHGFNSAHVNHVHKCNACQSSPDTWGTANSVQNGVDCVYTFQGPHRTDLSTQHCFDINFAETHCEGVHGERGSDAFNDCVFDECFAPGSMDTVPPVQPVFAACYNVGSDNFMDFAGTHKTVNGCALACAGHAFFAQRNGEQCYCGGEPDIALHSGNRQCSRCHTNPADFSTRVGLVNHVDCVYTFDSDFGAVGGSTCPEDFPFAYRPTRNFDYCCATAEDLWGSINNNNEDRYARSGHCWGHNYVRCGTPPCVDYGA